MSVGPYFGLASNKAWLDGIIAETNQYRGYKRRILQNMEQLRIDIFPPDVEPDMPNGINGAILEIIP